MIVATGCLLAMLGNDNFRNMITVLDPKFVLPSVPTLVKLLKKKQDRSVLYLKELVGKTDKVTICLDGWSKKGLTKSYIGVSACFYDISACKSAHIMLNLKELSLPHDGTQLSKAVEKCLKDWGIDKIKILMVVIDNEFNMVKMLKLLKQNTGNERTDNVIEVAGNLLVNNHNDEERNIAGSDDWELDEELEVGAAEDDDSELSEEAGQELQNREDNENESMRFQLMSFTDVCLAWCTRYN